MKTIEQYYFRMDQYEEHYTGIIHWSWKDDDQQMRGYEEYPESEIEYLENGQTHRLDGPAIEYSDQTYVWMIEGIEISFEDYMTEYFPKLTEEQQNSILFKLDDYLTSSVSERH